MIDRIPELVTEKYFDLSGFWQNDIFLKTSYPWEVIPKAEYFILSLFEAKKLTSNYKDSKNIYIGEGSKIEEGVVIKGPAIIGKNCVLGHGCFIRQNCILGDNVHIGHAVEIKNSIFLNNAKAAHLNYVGDSIVGNNVNLSGGSILANTRLDKREVQIQLHNQIINTTLKKLGAIVGDYSNIGANSVLNPGTVLGKHTIVYPLVGVKGVHQEKEIIKD